MIRAAGIALLLLLLFSSAARAAQDMLRNDGAGDMGAPTAEKNNSAIDRPDFKIRNLPYEPEKRSSEMPIDADEIRSAGIEAPSPEAILAEVPEESVMQYLDKTDFEKRLTAAQVAEKYLSAASPGAPASTDPQSLALRWLMMSDKDQRAAKMAWFAAFRSSISLDDFNRVVDLRKYRVVTALKINEPAGLRKVDVSTLTSTDIEKLKMPELKPLTGWDRTPNVMVVNPTIRPVLGEEPSIVLPEIPSAPEGAPARPDNAGPEGRPAAGERAPTLYGIPGSLRNGP